MHCATLYSYPSSDILDITMRWNYFLYIQKSLGHFHFHRSNIFTAFVSKLKKHFVLTLFLVFVRNLIVLDRQPRLKYRLII